MPLKYHGSGSLVFEEKGITSLGRFAVFVSIFLLVMTFVWGGPLGISGFSSHYVFIGLVVVIYVVASLSSRPRYQKINITQPGVVIIRETQWWRIDDRSRQLTLDSIQKLRIREVGYLTRRFQICLVTKTGTEIPLGWPYRSRELTKNEMSPCEKFFRSTLKEYANGNSDTSNTKSRSDANLVPAKHTQLQIRRWMLPAFGALFFSTGFAFFFIILTSLDGELGGLLLSLAFASVGIGLIFLPKNVIIFMSENDGEDLVIRRRNWALKSRESQIVPIRDIRDIRIDSGQHEGRSYYWPVIQLNNETTIDILKANLSQARAIKEAKALESLLPHYE